MTDHEARAREIVTEWFERGTDALGTGPHDRPVITETLVTLISTALRTAYAAGVEDAAKGWLPIESAPKDGTRLLLKFKAPLPVSMRDDLVGFVGIEFVGRHPGVADDGFDIGWSFAAPVGCGGFPDEWLDGWRPLPPGATP